MSMAVFNRPSAGECPVCGAKMYYKQTPIPLEYFFEKYDVWASVKYCDECGIQMMVPGEAKIARHDSRHAIEEQIQKAEQAAKAKVEAQKPKEHAFAPKAETLNEQSKTSKEKKGVLPFRAGRDKTEQRTRPNLDAVPKTAPQAAGGGMQPKSKEPMSQAGPRSSADKTRPQNAPEATRPKNQPQTKQAQPQQKLQGAQKKQPENKPQPKNEAQKRGGIPETFRERLPIGRTRPGELPGTMGRFGLSDFQLTASAAQNISNLLDMTEERDKRKEEKLDNQKVLSAKNVDDVIFAEEMEAAPQISRKGKKERNAPKVQTQTSPEKPQTENRQVTNDKPAGAPDKKQSGVRTSLNAAKSSERIINGQSQGNGHPQPEKPNQANKLQPDKRPEKVADQSVAGNRTSTPNTEPARSASKPDKTSQAVAKASVAPETRGMQRQNTSGQKTVAQSEKGTAHSADHVPQNDIQKQEHVSVNSHDKQNEGSKPQASERKTEAPAPNEIAENKDKQSVQKEDVSAKPDPSRQSATQAEVAAEDAKDTKAVLASGQPVSKENAAAGKPVKTEPDSAPVQAKGPQPDEPPIQASGEQPKPNKAEAEPHAGKESEEAESTSDQTETAEKTAEKDAEKSADTKKDTKNLDLDFLNLRKNVAKHLPKWVVSRIPFLADAVNIPVDVPISVEKDFVKKCEAPHRQEIIGNLLYDTDTSEMFLKKEGSYGFDRPCIHFNYRSPNGHFFRCSVRYDGRNKEGRVELRPMDAEMEVKPLLRNYPELYKRFFESDLRDA